MQAFEGFLKTMILALGKSFFHIAISSSCEHLLSHSPDYLPNCPFCYSLLLYPINYYICFSVSTHKFVQSTCPPLPILSPICVSSTQPCIQPAICPPSIFHSRPVHI